MTCTTPTPKRVDLALPVRRITTDELAALLRVKPATIRTRLCVNGHYLGLKPHKLENRRLLWDADAAERILAGEGRTR